MEKKWLKIIVFSLLLSWFGLFFCQKIDLTTADLGRHIKNGEMIVKGNWKVLTTNFYSYTEPEFPVFNHHFGSGVIFYLIQKVSGFEGLSLLNIGVNLAIFMIFFEVARKETGMKIATLLSLIMIPLMAARREVRPEFFSYLGIAIFFYLLWKNRRGEINKKWLWVLPIGQIFWTNMHIYFIFGPALVGLFWLEDILRKRKINKYLSLILGLTMLACLVSPFGLKGAIYPFQIFDNYGYQIVENKSVLFLSNWGLKEINLGWFMVVLGLMILSFVMQVWRNRKQFSLIYFVLALVWGGLGYMAIRNFSMFGCFALIIVSYNLRNAKLGLEKLGGEVVVMSALVILMISFSLSYQKIFWMVEGFGIGVAKNNQASVDFYKKLGVKGAIFNNYDDGGYLIYSLFPEERVFVDNRPEAYSTEFFQEIYIPAQTDQVVWKKLQDEYDFQTIFFSYLDVTPWSQEFLVKRVGEEEWAVVYFDRFCIIFVKRNEQNKQVIDKYEIDKKMIGITTK